VYETLGTYKGHSMCLVQGQDRGGELINPHKLPRKQQQGSGINGSAKFPVGPGDLIHVPVADATRGLANLFIGAHPHDLP
jgi:hypothetical protein